MLTRNSGFCALAVVGTLRCNACLRGYQGAWVVVGWRAAAAATARLPGDRAHE